LPPFGLVLLLTIAAHCLHRRIWRSAVSSAATPFRVSLCHLPKEGFQGGQPFLRGGELIVRMADGEGQKLVTDEAGQVASCRGIDPCDSACAIVACES
jgi:hypothetical protein